MSPNPPRKHKIVIVGAGFAGVRAALHLSRNGSLDVTLISSQPHFSYYPQLYHAATGGVRSEAAIPLTELFADHPITLVKDAITKFDPKAKTVSSANITYPYDDLLLAMGNVTNYFGIKGLDKYSYDIKTIAGAERFKQHLHDELLDKVPDINYVVVGGGPTGVELAASLGDYMRRITKLHGIPHPQYSIKLVEAAPRILPRLPEAMSARVSRRLRELGVQVMIGATVEAETATKLKLKGETLDSHSVVWTAGVTNNPFFRDNAEHFTLAKNGKVEVDGHLQSRPHVYVLGDNAATQYSGMAQTALHDADYVVEDLMCVLTRHPRAPYRPKAPVSVIPVGENWAAAQWGPVLLYGFVGYILRRFADLIGYADVESWPKAVRLALQDGKYEDNCSICASKN